MSQTKSIYAAQWDWYVDHFNGEGWPGDEWGTEANWNQTFTGLFAGVETWEHAVEIGSGAGKYTERVLRSSDAIVHAFDISEKFLGVLADRLRADVDAGRLRTSVLDGLHSDQMLTELDSAGWVRKVDALYSIDAMVHVDLQYLAAYIVTAGLVLREGGHLIMTLADVTTNGGFAKLMNDLRPVFPRQVDRLLTAKFEWLAPDAVRSVVSKLGFEIVAERRTRDFEFAAKLVSPEVAEQFRTYLTGA